MRDKVFNKYYQAKAVPIQSAWRDELVDDRVEAYENKEVFKHR